MTTSETAKYTAEKATQWGVGGSANGTGRRVKLSGAFTIDPSGRRCRAFRDSEGGIEAAQRWADYCNEHFLK